MAEFCKYGNKSSASIEGRDLFDKLSDYQLLKIKVRCTELVVKTSPHYIWFQNDGIIF
jgi:hypothetical protein